MELTEKALKEATLKIKNLLETNKLATILVHHNADPDAIGSAVALSQALSQFKVKCTVFAPADISRQSMAILSKYPYPIQEKSKLESLVFIVDSSSKEQVPVDIPKECAVVLIDHHRPGNLVKRANIAVVDSASHSTAGLVLSVLKELSANLTREIRFFLLAGLVADTAFLRKASRDDLKKAVELSKDIELSDIFSSLNTEEEVSERIAKLQSAKRLELYRINDFLIAFSHIGSFESRSALSLVKSGADIAIVFNLQKKELRLSGRMRSSVPEKLDLARVFRSLDKIIEGGGGGHRTAASANGKNTKSISTAKYNLISYFEKSLAKKAKKIL
ncbi:MAG: DHH family phosphoesterase [Candidatus Aenigmarchaeota archaeon]|nr:DHH family phosphoesterase [Candidatus Aenigmarchaeota archaeon]